MTKGKGDVMSNPKMKSYTVTILAATLAIAGAAHALMAVCSNGPCGGTIPPPRQPPVQYVSPPDIVVQFSSCLNSAAPAFVDGLKASVVNAMKTLDVHHDDPPPNPDVRASCVNGKQLFGAWLYQPGSYGVGDTATARNVGLSQQNVIGGSETFGFQFRSDGIRRLVSIRMADQPLTLDDDGNPDPSGDVHLNGNFALEYTNSDYYGRAVVDLGLDGWYDGLFSNTDFTLHIYDFLTVNQYGSINCDTATWAAPTETTVDTILASLTGGAGGSLGDIIDAGPGCKIAQMVPRSILVPGSNLKAVFNYTRISAYDGSGLTLAGMWSVKQRQASVTFYGPFSLEQEPNLPFSGTYTAQASDLRPPLSFSWTSLNATPVSGTNHPTMVWNLPNLAVGQSVQRNLALTVTDADGLKALAVRPIHLTRVQVVDDTDPVCKAKPWQCPPDL
jgi:hypothetical protein